MSFVLRWSYWVGTLVIIGLCVAVIGIYQDVTKELPNVNAIYNPPMMSTKIVDRNGKLLYKFYDGEDRSWVKLDKIPQSLIWSTLAIEDKDFYKHHGLSIRGIVRALIFDITKEDGVRPQGGSTITQQLVKVVFLSGEQKWQRKLKEAILAIVIENKLSKDQILERYLNQVAYGGDTYGVQEAAQKYFGKDVENLSLAESSFLAGLPASPTSYSPYGINKQFAYDRHQQVINQLISSGMISPEIGEKVKAEKLELKPEKKIIKAPHFVFYIKNILESKYGYVNFGRLGLTVRTSLDLSTQIMAEEIVQKEVAGVKKLHITNGAAMVVGVKDGDILAMVGSKDYYADDIDGKFNVTTALRQPGSSIKPINYLLALKNGKTLASLVNDSPVSYQIKGQKPYNPQNYNGKFMGPVTLRTALASSLNIPSVKLLAENGVENMIDLAKTMGINTWNDRSRFGLALALGGGEVKMTEFVEAYSVFANMGEKIKINPILEIKNYLGEIVYQKQIEKTRVVEAEYAYLINDVLSDDVARAPIFGLNSKLHIPGRTVAVKTGTTNVLKDNWCIGWTPSVLVAVWVGNNDSSPMSWVASGVSGATPIWNRILSKSIGADEKWEKPVMVNKKNICGRDEYFIDGTEKEVKCPIRPTETPTR